MVSKQGQSKIVWLGLWNNFTHAINKKQMVILKLDIEKAFDTIEHEAILEILLAKGFGEK